MAAVRLYALAVMTVAFAGPAVRTPARLAARRHEVHMVEGEAMVVVLSTRAQMARSEVMSESHPSS